MCKIKSLIVAFMLLLPLQSFAQQTPAKPDQATIDEAKKHFDEAAKALAEKNYEEAAKQYEAAYNLIPDASLLNNIAYCYLKKEDFEEARKRYQAYLDLAPYATNRAQVEGTIKELDKKISEKKQQAELEQKKKEADEAAKKLQEATLALTQIQADIKRREEEERLRREAEEKKKMAEATPAALKLQPNPAQEKNPTKTLLWLGVGTVGLAVVAGAAVGVYGLSQSKIPTTADATNTFKP